MARGRLITFEGLDGAGKSTHVEWFANRLRARGIAVLVTREPGGTPLGERLRELLLEKSMDAGTEALLMFAARNEHLKAVILPALEQAKWVVCDRFTDATMAYQGGGRGIPLERLAVLERWVQGALQPDLSVYLDVPVAVARKRLDLARPADRFEREEEQFFERVRGAYLRRAQEFPERIVVVNAAATVESIQRILENIILTRCQ